METNLHNIFKSRNARKLAKLLTESSYKVLLDKVLLATIKRLARFYGPLNFEQFLPLNSYKFGNILRKVV